MSTRKILMSPKPTSLHDGRLTLSEKTSDTDDQRIRDVTPLPPPEHLIRFFPIAGTPVEKLIGRTREAVRRIMHGEDDRLLVIIGPCSIHDPAAALEYARKLLAQREAYADTLEVVMRVYFEKPRTTVGWKGYINDPRLDGSFRINEGLRRARELLLEATYADPNGEVQTLRSTSTLWPAGVIAGIKTEGWVSAAKQVRFQALALDLTGKPQAGVALDVKAVARITTTSRKRLVGGFYTYDNKTDTKDLGSVCSGKSDDRGLLLCDTKLGEPGEVELVVTAKDAQGNSIQAEIGRAHV